MPEVDIFLRVEAENIEELFIQPNFLWVFELMCMKCQETHKNQIKFSEFDIVKGKNDRSEWNFTMKCKGCNNQMTIDFVEKKHGSIVIEDGKGEGILSSFELRGCDFTKWIPGEGTFQAKGTSGTIFEEVDILDLWSDYDEKTKEPVTVEKVEWSFRKSKKK